jgi:hypothetical protein
MLTLEWNYRKILLRMNLSHLNSTNDRPKNEKMVPSDSDSSTDQTASQPLRFQQRSYIHNRQVLDSNTQQSLQDFDTNQEKNSKIGKGNGLKTIQQDDENMSPLTSKTNVVGPSAPTLNQRVQELINGSYEKPLYL